jgi:hypothetical protein
MISFASLLLAYHVGETAAVRLHATELLLLLGTAIVFLVERPAWPAPLAASQRSSAAAPPSKPTARSLSPHAPSP